MKSLNITIKIWLSIGVFVVGYIFATILGQVQGRSTERVLRVTAETLFPAAQAMQESEAGFQRIVKAFGDSVVVQDASGLEAAKKDSLRLSETLKKAGNAPGISTQRAAAITKIAAATSRFLTDANEIYGTVLANPAAMNADMQQRMRDLAVRTDALKLDLAQARKDSAEDLLKQLNDLQEKSAFQRSLGLTAFAVILLIAGAIVHLTIRGAITGPIARVIDGVDRAADQAKSASERMASTGNANANSAQEQAAYIQETSASLEEISCTTRANAERAVEADRLMQEARQTMDHASESMTDLKTSMDVISQSSRQVSVVLKSINEIAFHTNILALNAAIEAARGRGSGLRIQRRCG